MVGRKYPSTFVAQVRSIAVDRLLARGLVDARAVDQDVELREALREVRREPPHAGLAGHVELDGLDARVRRIVAELLGHTPPSLGVARRHDDVRTLERQAPCDLLAHTGRSAGDQAHPAELIVFAGRRHGRAPMKTRARPVTQPLSAARTIKETLP